MHSKGSVIGLAACCLALSLAGCSDHVQKEWKNRMALPSCGTVTVQPNSSLEQGGGEELACFTAAFESGEPAELRVEQFTQEGDPVINYYRVTDEGRTEVYVDSTKDPNSDEKWSFGECDQPKSVLDVC